MQGRIEHRAAVDAALFAARSGASASIVIEGEPGIGKTCMCDYAVAQADGFAIVHAQGIESEYDMPFSGLSQLFAPFVSHLPQLPAPQRDALESALALTGAIPTSPLTLGAATLSLLAIAAENQPVLAVVDDAHWIDTASAHAITFAARRLGRDSVALILAQRTEDGHPTETRGLSSLHLDALEPPAAAALVADVAGVHVPDHVSRALLDATAGNPLALIEVVRTLTPAMLAGHESLPNPLRIAPRLEDVYQRRIAALPQRTQAALVVLAADSSGSLVLIEPALRELGFGIDALEAAEHAGVVVIEGPNAFFKHPLMRSAAYHDAPA
ncbi:MAG: hypothetical protein QOI44_1563, partial [Actinomycetota bacterium]|nr:hypothetical protein [Actinomycetota bacterium]